jgi:arylsulfatase A-like enzyme
MRRAMNRRQALKLLGGTAASLALAPLARSAESSAERPNVLFIAVDDLNDWIGCLGGHPDTKTPNIDRLAERGVLFTNAFCAAPACNPSRAALMTGIRPSTSGVYHNPQPWRKAMPDAVTLPQHFMAHGYRAVGGGKIYHGAFPDPSSWQAYFPSQTQNKPDDPVPEERPLNGIPNTSHFDWGPIDAADEEMGDWKVADWAIGELGKEHDKPFFLGVGIFRPHLPWYVPRKYFEPFPVDSVALPEVNENDLDDVPPIGREMAIRSKEVTEAALAKCDHGKVINTNNWRRAVQAYLASIHFADTCIGRVIDALDNSRYAENTIIVLWGDHGWHLGEKLHWRKFALWEEATHCPLIIAAPGMEAGRCTRTVNLLDIYPTLVDLCGLSRREELEGDSLMKLLKEPAAEWDRPALTTHGRNNHTVRTEQWRYIRYSDGSEELYDRDNDPLEWTNLAGREEHADLKTRLAKWFPKENAPDAPRQEKKSAKKS